MTKQELIEWKEYLTKQIQALQLKQTRTFNLAVCEEISKLNKALNNVNNKLRGAS